MKNFLIILISLYALYLRINWRIINDFARDEFFQLTQLKVSFLRLLETVPHSEHCLYLQGDYYLMYPFFKIFGFSKWVALPHFIITLLGFYLLYLLCKSYCKTIWGYIIAFGIVCLNPTLIKHATEIRVYAVLPTLALGCLYLCLQLANGKIKRKWLAGIFFIFTIWFHAYGILILTTAFIFSFLANYKSFNKDVFKLMIIVFCIAMPLWVFSVIMGDKMFKEGVDTFQWISSPFKSPINFSKDVFANLIGYTHKQLYILLIGVGLPFIFPLKERFRQISFFIVMIVFPIGAILVADIINDYWFIQRQFIWVMPFFAFFLGWTWDSFLCYAGKKVAKGK